MNGVGRGQELRLFDEKRLVLASKTPHPGLDKPFVSLDIIYMILIRNMEAELLSRMGIDIGLWAKLSFTFDQTQK